MMEGGRNGLSEDNETGDSKDCAGRQQYREGSTKGEGEVGRQGEGEERRRQRAMANKYLGHYAAYGLRNAA